MTNPLERMLFRFTLLPAYSLALFVCPSVFADSNDINAQIAKLEEDFRVLSSEFYQQASNNTGKRLPHISDIDQLYANVKQLVDNQNPITAISLLYLNIDTVKENIEHEALFYFTELSLENNESHLANILLSDVQYEGDTYLLSTMQFIFARYHASRKDWPRVIELLDGIYGELSLENAAYAYLLNGVALQYLKKHRRAIESFNKIPVISDYYAHAQLNIAIANIRQGWWTDAQEKIHNAILRADNDNSDELVNRLYLVLGYALLQKEYYRDARDAFRHVALDSRYTNRALLGIGLTATGQGDYVGGLNALSILKDKKTTDLSVDESYLLIPHVYEKLQQELTANANYTDALNYYQRRIDDLEQISNRQTSFSAVQYDEKSSSIVIDKNSLDYGKWYPESFITSYRQLLELLSATENSELKARIRSLLSRYNAAFQNIVAELLGHRTDYLRSYLNQSRYGLARLYDKSNEASN